ncbi:spore cortex-lytic enzyme [Desulfuribacillus alkaliarsenatis]|uniref:Spore cortex-lytic enzyme n=1 Tax=Desulfuribacillus alkaliarsenatis TaxID=766136 RepID=A0A1E5FZN5_9FIRM|nr:spore cortex-lytic enzyme [Desulfuribacillus alkaliarsenatis]OEF96041.1 spore cortex-lytic enzyme [Desulfuribacillus alkaliarsenatis]
MKSKKIVLIFLTFILILNVISLTYWQTQETARVLRYGAQGNDVTELQTRLNQLGYYTFRITGIYGWRTQAAVRNFQRDYGLVVDGIAGPQTWGALRRNTHLAGATGPARGFTDQEINLLVNLVNGEARGEPYIGQVAVVAVVLNRVRNQQFPNTVSGVVFEPRAFTAVADGQIWLTPTDPNLRQAVMDAINGWDPTNGALYFFNPETSTSPWIWSRPQIKQIGRHIFAY